MSANAAGSEIVEGRSLARLMADQGPLPLEQYLPILAQVLEALKAEHAAGRVHGTLCPERVMVSPGDTSDVVRLLGAGAGGRSTPYNSPEQAEGRAVDHRSDVYSFGVILYELLCGRLPFEPGTLASLEDAPRGAPARTPASVLESPTGRSLDAIARRCLLAEPNQRFASVGELDERLRQVMAEELAGDGYSVPEDWTYEAPRSPLRRWAVVGAVGVLLLGGGGILVAGRGRPATSAVTASPGAPVPTVPATPIASAPAPAPAATPALAPPPRPAEAEPPRPSASPPAPEPAPALAEVRPEPAQPEPVAAPEPPSTEVAKAPDERAARTPPAPRVRHTAQNTIPPRPAARAERAAGPAKSSARRSLDHEGTVDPFN